MYTGPDKQVVIDNDDKPLISADTHLPEITFKAVVVAFLLTVLLGASNAYLALKVGTTVAASIPAAVISMGIFRLFKKSNVLENNLVQTAASAGEGLAAAVTFILPALVILHYWVGFDFWKSAAVTALGGTLGVLFSVPLRRVLLGIKGLPFPEGTAIGNVLRASATGGAQIKYLVRGGIGGGFLALCQTGFQVIASYMPLWLRSGSTLFGTTLGFDPVLIGAGYIVGINANIAMISGLISCWLIGVPILCSVYGIPATGSHYDQVMTLWSHHIRYIGVGTMMVAGIWTLITLLKPMVEALAMAVTSMKNMRAVNAPAIIRTEKDIPIHYVFGGTAVLLIATFFLIFYSVGHGHGALLPFGLSTGVALIGVLGILLLGFISSLICGYLVGLIGSTNTPLSGIIIINVVVLSLILFPLIGSQMDLSVHLNSQTAIAIVIFIATVIGCAATVTNENIQDLKAGQMVGATPWKQQTMMIFGVVVSAFVIAPVLQLLFQAYGIGGAFPHPGMNPAQMLPAPQAGLIAALAQGIMGHSLPSGMLTTGALIAVVCIVIDEMAKRRGYRFPVLAVGLGIYLPPEIIVPFFFGGMVSYLAHRNLNKSVSALPAAEQKTIKKSATERGVLSACGLVAGSSLMGVALAIPFAIKGSADVLQLVPASFTPIANILGVITTLALCIWVYRSVTVIRKQK